MSEDLQGQHKVKLVFALLRTRKVRQDHRRSHLPTWIVLVRWSNIWQGNNRVRFQHPAPLQWTAAAWRRRLYNPVWRYDRPQAQTILRQTAGSHGASRSQEYLFGRLLFVACRDDLELAIVLSPHPRRCRTLGSPPHDSRNRVHHW